MRINILTAFMRSLIVIHQAIYPYHIDIKCLGSRQGLPVISHQKKEPGGLPLDRPPGVGKKVEK